MNKNKGFASIVLIGTIVLVVIVGGLGTYYFNNLSKNISTNTQTEITSKYGFKFTVPNGWHIWEGMSAGVLTGCVSLQNDANRKIEMVGTIRDEHKQKLTKCKDDLIIWDVGSSSIILFTKNTKIDYRDRDLNRLAIFEDENATTDVISLDISSGNIDINSQTSNTSNGEIKNIDINGTTARLIIAKEMSPSENSVIILYPIKSNKFIRGEKAGHIFFSRNIKKDDTDAVNETIEFVRNLKIINPL